MATQNQIEANRRNAQKSTGPRSAEGKAASRFNAVKSGIYAKSQVIPGEDPEQLAALTAEYYDEFQPATALARFLVDALVSADWQLRRLRRIEAQLWQKEFDTAQASTYHRLHETAPLGDLFDRGPATFMLLQRRIDSAERSFYRALKQLQRLQAVAGTPTDSVPAPGPESPAPEPELASFPTSSADPPSPEPCLIIPVDSPPSPC